MSDEKEILDFLDSLPEGEVASTTNKAGKSDAEILDFLDELDINDEKKIAVEAPVKPVETKKPAVIKEETPIEKAASVEQAAAVEETDFVEENAQPVESAISSITSWWSNGGSAKVSTQISSFWDTAQSLSEDAIKAAREQGIDGSLRTVFSEIGISGIQDTIKFEKMLSFEQIEDIKKLNVNEAREAVRVLNSRFEEGLSFVGKSVGELIGIEKKSESGEEIEIVLTHDMNNFNGLNEMIRNIFEDVMSKQVDGKIDVSVIEKSSNVEMKSDGCVKFGLFNGKGSDAEKLVLANIENEVKLRGDVVDGKTNLFVSLIAWSLNKDNGKEIDEDSSIVIDSYSSNSVTFLCVLKDVVHDINITTQSQPIPLKWCNWIEQSGKRENDEDKEDEEDDIEPSEWVIEWVTESIRNLIGITSQSYIIKRMGY